MNLLLSVGDWFAQNWMLLLLIVVAVLLIVPTYFKSRKEANERNELNNKIVKGTKIITTAGIYGVVESIENTTDGKVVTIVTGNDKHPSTMTIHINAIGGIDNKTDVVEESKELTSVVNEEVSEDIDAEIIDKDEIEEKKPVKKSSTAKTSKTTKK